MKISPFYVRWFFEGSFMSLLLLKILLWGKEVHQYKAIVSWPEKPVICYRESSEEQNSIEIIVDQWSVNQYLGFGKYLFILQISIMYRFMKNSLISILMLSIKKYILIYWYFQYFTVPFLKSHESFVSRGFMKSNTSKASSAHSIF